MHIFRQGLLEGRAIALAGPVPGPVRQLLGELGARTGDDQTAPLDVLVVADSGDVENLLAQTWTSVHTIATEVFIPAQAGRIVLIAPPQDTGVVKAALENLARTLSVEWARYGITTSAIAPGAATGDDELATMTAYLCSEAGAYFSGCRFDMR